MLLFCISIALSIWGSEGTLQTIIHLASQHPCDASKYYSYFISGKTEGLRCLNQIFKSSHWFDLGCLTFQCSADHLFSNQYLKTGRKRLWAHYSLCSLLLPMRCDQWCTVGLRCLWVNAKNYEGPSQCPPRPADARGLCPHPCWSATGCDKGTVVKEASLTLGFMDSKARRDWCDHLDWSVEKRLHEAS